MKKRVVQSLALLMVIFLTGVSCSEDNPIFTKEHTEGCIDPGDLEIFARLGGPAGPFYGGADVQLFLSENDRANGNVYKLATTPTSNPDLNGAMFYDLAFQQYYIKIQFVYDDGTGDATYTGTTEAYAPTCTTTKVHVACVK